MSASWDAVAASIKAGAISGLNRAAVVVADRAKELAPVSGGGGVPRRIRFKTMAEVRADREARRTITQIEVERGLPRWREYVAAPRTRLTSRRGMTKAKIAVPIRGARATGQGGGRLRDEITAVPATGEGSRYEARVISPTPYAKFQEFGTRHNSAHPYLRPALHESRGEVLALVRAGVRSAIKGETEVVVDLE